METSVLKNRRHSPAGTQEGKTIDDTLSFTRCQNWDYLCHLTNTHMNISVEIESLRNRQDFQNDNTISEALMASLSTINNHNRRISRIAGQIAAERACQIHFPELGDTPPTVSRKSSGKPVVENMSNAHVSISHSAELAVACAARIPVGVDIEKIERRPECLIRYFFSRKEKDWLMKQATISADAATVLWTRKEAVSKLLGQGGQIPFRTIPVLDSESPHCLSSYVIDQYAVTIAYASEESLL